MYIYILVTITLGLQSSLNIYAKPKLYTFLFFFSAFILIVFKKSSKHII